VTVVTPGNPLLTWNPDLDPRLQHDENEMLDCFLCRGKVERRHAIFFGEDYEAQGFPGLDQHLPAHPTCLSQHPAAYLWLQWRNNLDDVVKAGLPRSVLKNLR